MGKRCQVCNNHEYLILTTTESGWQILHTHLEVMGRVFRHDDPGLADNEMIHYWRIDGYAMEGHRSAPECILVYKEVKV